MPDNQINAIVASRLSLINECDLKGWKYIFQTMDHTMNVHLPIPPDKWFGTIDTNWVHGLRKTDKSFKESNSQRGDKEIGSSIFERNGDKDEILFLQTDNGVQ